MAFWNRKQKQEKSDIRQKGQALGFAGYAASDVGCLRENNEDNYILCGYINRKSEDHSEMGITAPAIDHWQCIGVFDGMGGGEVGELASKCTATIFQSMAAQIYAECTRTDVDEAVRGAFLEGNNQIVDLQKQYQVFGTTGTVMCTDGRVFRIYHLGDSRAYLFREGQLFQLTRDQTVAQMKIDVGLYDESHPQAHAEKHKLTEYIGRDWTRENIRPVESEWIAVTKKDRVLLCSDGLYDMCSRETIGEVLRSSTSVKMAAKRLVQSAIQNGGEDNVTCILVEFF